MIKTKHGNIKLPAFFPTIGWPGGRGEYDYFFKSLNYFSKKINHYHFLFNFSSFVFGFTIPRSDFNKQYFSFRGKDIRDILIENTDISHSLAKKIIVLLDIGGNRIFNKIIYEGLSPISIHSYNKYFAAYRDFIEHGNPDIFVTFDIGPSYTTKDEISKKGISVWNSLTEKKKRQINNDLLLKSIGLNNRNNLIMVPVNAENVKKLKESLALLFKNYLKEINIIGLAGIANKSEETVNKALKTFYEFKKENNWNVLSHGLGMGGWKNIPYLVKYEIDSCDVATPWRRACTDRISAPYLPLLDDKLNFTNIPNAFSYCELYDEIYSTVKCGCPFCKDLSLKEIQGRCKRADKKYTGKKLHDEDFRKMRIRIFFHNVYQHIALFKKLSEYKNKFKDQFMDEFLKEIPEGKTKRIFSRLNI